MSKTHSVFEKKLNVLIVQPKVVQSNVTILP